MTFPRRRLRAPVRVTPLVLALLLSALAHAVTLTGSWLRLPAPHQQNNPAPLLARLEPAATTLPQPEKHAPVKPIATSQPTRIAAAPPTLRTDAPAAWMQPAAIEPAPEADTTPLNQPSPMTAEAASPATEPVIVATAAPTTFVPEPANIRTLPRRGRITYALNYYLSNLPTTVGRTVQTWEAVDNTYKLDSLSETVGLARFTRFGPRAYHSSGRVTERGLLPTRFTSKVVVSGKPDDSAAQFDWDKNTLQFGRTAEKNHPLPAGAQDLLSFMYQLALAPPPRGRLQLPVTNGVRFESYELDVLDEEIIETPLGNFRALPVKQVRRAGNESIEVWLAADYQYLPVRIRFIGRDGTPGGEQIATEISVGAN